MQALSDNVLLSALQKNDRAENMLCREQLNACRCTIGITINMAESV
jgi:hypothetical protein